MYSRRQRKYTRSNCLTHRQKDILTSRKGQSYTQIYQFQHSYDPKSKIQLINCLQYDTKTLLDDNAKTSFLFQGQTLLKNDLDFTPRKKREFSRPQKLRQKNGEGIVVFNNGLVVIGRWQRDLLSGKAMIFTPFGGQILAQFSEGKLNGWSILTYLNTTMICQLYYYDKFDGTKLIYDVTQKLWISSIQKQKKLQIIQKIQKGQQYQLPSFYSQNTLANTLQLIQTNQIQSLLNLKHIHKLNLDKEFTYIGFINEDNKPHGLGVVFSNFQCYSGYYQNGVLEQLGRMVFKNGEIYAGGFSEGAIRGEGVSYDPKKNYSTIAIHDGDFYEIKNGMEGYVSLEFYPNIGTPNHHFHSGISLQGLNLLCETVQCYYFRHFVQNHIAVEKSKEEQNSRGLPLKQINILQNNEPIKGQNNFRKASNTFPEQQQQIQYGRQNSMPKRQRQRPKRIDTKQKKIIMQTLKVASPPRKTFSAGDYDTRIVKQNVNKKQSEEYNKQIPKQTEMNKKTLLRSGIKQVESNTIMKNNERKQRIQVKDSEEMINRNKQKQKEISTSKINLIQKEPMSAISEDRKSSNKDEKSTKLIRQNINQNLQLLLRKPSSKRNRIFN